MQLRVLYGSVLDVEREAELRRAFDLQLPRLTEMLNSP